MADTEQQLTSYRGNCHCGAFVYEIQLPEIKSVFQCNCSLCAKKGYLLVFPEDTSSFKVVKGDEKTLTGYTFGPGKLSHMFCSHCATPVMGRALGGGMPGKQIALNVHAMQGVSTRDLEKIPVDGGSGGSPYDPPAHKGGLPTAEIEGGKLYTGGCHCGNVTVALKSKPLDETYEDLMQECNCSICERNGYVWVYPKPEQLVLAGDESHIGRYKFGRGLEAKTFCKTCGVNLTNVQVPLSEEAFAALSEKDQKWREMSMKLAPVNTRVLNGVDAAKLAAKAKKFDGASALGPSYVNP